MIETLLVILLIELTIGCVLGGYVLYEIQTALAVIVLHDCANKEDVEPFLLHQDVEVLDAEPPPPVDDATDTIGTFTGAAWK